MESTSHPHNNPAGSDGLRNKQKQMWLAIVGVVVLAALTIWAFSSMNRNSGGDGPTASIEMTAEGLTPDTITIKAGQSVAITNQDEVAHKLTADQEILEGFVTPEPLEKGSSFSYTFESSGTFRFYDPEAPQKYVGTVIVE